jgi:hypothetical protein
MYEFQEIGRQQSIEVLKTRHEIESTKGKELKDGGGELVEVRSRHSMQSPRPSAALPH